MKLDNFGLLTLVLVLGLWSGGQSVRAASPSSELLKAKHEAELKGYILETSRDEIVTKAKREGKLRVTTTLSPTTIKELTKAFKTEYPFLDLYVQEIAGSEAQQRFVLEIKAGGGKQWDAVHISEDFYKEYQPFLKKIDILGMASHRVLNVPVRVVDPTSRAIVSAASNLQIVAYNEKLMAAGNLPDAWEDFLKPEFKGKKFLADIRPQEIAALVPAWGLEKTLDFARRIGAQDPVWIRGGTRMITAVAAGEYMLFIGPNLQTVLQAKRKDPAGQLAYKILEPIPTRLRENIGTLETADHPYGALLWMEFETSPKGQKILDEHEPYGASVLIPGSKQQELAKGRKLSVVMGSDQSKMGEWVAKVVEAYGFPKTQSK